MAVVTALLHAWLVGSLTTNRVALAPHGKGVGDKVGVNVGSGGRVTVVVRKGLVAAQLA
jgi:hypothetical protein